MPAGEKNSCRAQVSAFRASGQRHGALDLAGDGGGIDGAAEAAAGVVVPDGTAVAARHHEQRPVVERAVVEHDPDRQQVVVGVRVERPVLMPLDRRAVARRLEVDLGAVQPDPRAEQPLEQGDESRVADQALEAREEPVRRLDPPHARRLGPMPRLEVVHLGVVGDLPRALEDLRHLPAELVEGRRLEHAGHDEIALFAIERHVPVRDHLRSFAAGRPTALESEASTRRERRQREGRS